MVEGGTFEVSLEVACTLHAIAAKNEALKWGRLRSGGVTIAGTTSRAIAGIVQHYG